ncbi:ABC transporter substrate-binding protein [Pseudonocardia sp. RS11V-5]|uniref:ABC transporter substrate-binding protein n=1 Tax=Pseudonocardia terrae TaxID=2905831 RepID=UPI001E400FA0|nr:ABC transporter substrate-binding protein [Pseudonocardia terrae]MCE3550879.1 ABC transporter substrate-binding protein [Pseudonocardia terrae]
MATRYNAFPKGALAAAAAVAAVALVAGCGGGSSGSGGSGETIKIGEIDSLTGASRTYGVPQHNGIQLAVDEINGKGGVTVGGTKYQLELTTEDDKSDPATGVAAVQKLLSQDDSHFIVGTLSSEVASAYIPVIKNRDDVVNMVVGAAVAGITDYPPVYRPRVTSAQYTPQQVDFLDQLAKQSPITNVGIVYDQTHSGVVQQLPVIKQKLADGHYTVAAEQAFDLSASTFDTQIAAVLRGGAQAVFFQGYAPDAATFVKQSRAAGYTGPIITAVGFTSKDVQNANVPSAAMNGVYDIGAPFPKDLVALGSDKASAAKTFADAYQAKFNDEPGFTSASAYNGVYILAKALEQASSPKDYAGVKKALDGMKTTDVPNLAESIIPQTAGEIFTAHQAYFQSAVHVWKDNTFQATALVG